MTLKITCEALCKRLMLLFERLRFDVPHELVASIATSNNAQRLLTVFI